jgi:hypothetical protein
MSEALELFLLEDGGSGKNIALGRRGNDIAIESLPIDAAFKSLQQFRDIVEGVVLGKERRPKAIELRKFGEALFAWLFRGTLYALYSRVPAGSISLQILSNCADIQSLPWEYMLPPDRKPVPNRERCVVRVLPTCGIDFAVAKPAKSKIRVLLVVSDPVDQPGVVWDDVRAVIDRAFRAQLPEGIELKVVEGANRTTLAALLLKESFDIFHFIGHGDIHNGEGALVLNAVNSDKSDFFMASDLAIILSGRGVKLALLSACLTAKGNFRDDFGVVAVGLMRAGIPAVVANQFSIPNKSIAPFVGALYATLLATGDIDCAVMDGRIALAVGLGGTTGGDAIVEWGIPILYRLANASHLFSV